MAYSIYTYGSQYVDAGQIGIYLGTREENLRECLEVIAAELADVGAGNLRDGELERAKENMRGRMLLSLESTSARMTRLGKATVTGTEIIPIEEVEERIASVTPDEIATLARQLFAPEHLSVAAIGPSERRFGAAVRALQPRPRPRMRVLLFGREGKVGTVLMRALHEAGHEVEGVELGEQVEPRGLRRCRRLHRARPPSGGTPSRPSPPAFRA